VCCDIELDIKWVERLRRMDPKDTRAAKSRTLEVGEFHPWQFGFGVVVLLMVGFCHGGKGSEGMWGLEREKMKWV